MDTDLWATIINIVTVWIPQIVTVASIVTAATPTKKDNQILSGILNVIRLLGLNVGRARPEE